VILYELLTGHAPFGPTPMDSPPEETADDLLRRQRRGCRPVRELNPAVDRALAQLVERCLAFDPARRPRDAAEAAAELRRQEQAAVRKRWLWTGAAAVLALMVGASAVWANRAVLFPETTKKREPATPTEFIDRGRERVHDAEEATRKGDSDAAELALTGAVSDLLYAFDKSKADPEVHRDAAACLAWALMMRGDHMAAASRASEALEAVKEEMLKQAEMDRRQAMDRSQDALSLGLESAALLNNRAFCLMRISPDKPSKALKDLDAAVGITKDLTAARYHRAKLLLRLRLEHPNEDLPDRALDDIEETVRNLGTAPRQVEVDAVQLYALAAEDRLRSAGASPQEQALFGRLADVPLLRTATQALRRQAYLRRLENPEARRLYGKALEHAERVGLVDELKLFLASHPALRDHPGFQAWAANSKPANLPEGYVPLLVDPMLKGG
jgi:hypothetical protein